MTTVVEMKNVAKYFGEGSSKVKALDGVDLTIQEGEFVAIVGPSGSGKSTMMNLIGCLDRPTSGKVKIAGEDLSKLNDKKGQEVASANNSAKSEAGQAARHKELMGALKGKGGDAVSGGASGGGPKPPVPPIPVK